MQIVDKNPSDFNDKHTEYIKSMQATFDARILVFKEDSLNKIVEHMMWRSI